MDCGSQMPACQDPASLGCTTAPACKSEMLPTTTISPSLIPERISTLLAVCKPVSTLRTSTLFFGVTTYTRPSCSAVTGIVTTCSRRSTPRLTSAYIPGINVQLGFGTSTSVCMVLVSSDNVSANL